MKKEEIKQIVLDYICKNNGVSFAELEYLFQANGYSYTGEYEKGLKENHNIVLWSGWSKDSFDVLGELEEQGKIHMEPTSILIYLTDGKCLTYPVVKSTREYKTKHWCPVVFCTGKNVKG